MSEPARWIDRTTLVLCLAAAVAWFVLAQPSAPRPTGQRLSALAAIPERAALLISVDLERVRDSPVASVLSQPGLPGVGGLTDACANSPIEKASALAFALPESEGDMELGVAAMGHFAREGVEACAHRMIEARGGQVTRTQVGSFIAVRDRSGRGGEVAIREGGPLLLSEGRFLRDMVDTAEGRQPSVLANKLHQNLRRRVGEDAAIVGSWRLPRDWVERLVGPITEGRTPLTTLVAAALRIDLSTLVQVKALLVCTNAKECQEVATYLRDLRTEVGPLLTARLGDELLNEAEIRVADQTLEISVALSHARAMRLALRWFGRE
jgi:hypothetical protein